MAWVRIHDGAMTHPKIVGLTDKAFRLWVWGLSYSQQHLTNGSITIAAAKLTRVFSAAQLLVQEKLWDATPGGFQIHDYLDWNDSKEVVIEARQLARVRMALVRDPQLRQALRDRDRDICRYCSIEVNWADRKSRAGATYDHVIPGGGDSLDNLVIACRGCNSRKNQRTPEQAGLVLQPPPRSESVSRFINAKTRVISSGVGSSSALEEETATGNLIVSEALADRAGRFVERFAELYSEKRKGAKYLRRQPALDWDRATKLCQTWDDGRLEKMAVIFLTTDDEWISGTDRGFAVFCARATWCDERLAAWEAQQRKPA